LFSSFLRPPDKRKNSDWSNFMNNPIDRSDWSAICHSSTGSSQFHSSRNWFESSVEEMLRSLVENGIKLVSFVIELMRRQEEQ